MILDGKKIAEDIQKKMRKKVMELRSVPVLCIIQAGENRASEKFVERKKKFGESIGVPVELVNLPAEAREEEILAAILFSASDERVGGIVVQLPLPLGYNTQKILNMIPIEKDVDALSDAAMEKFANGNLGVMPPVAGAIKKIFEYGKISVRGKRAVVIGRGRLVGVPAEIFLRRSGAEVTVVDDTVSDIARETKRADILISGAGSPHLVTLDKIKKGVVLIDAGTSQNDDGRLVGDACPSCVSKCALFTPVPGGIGPITVAMVFDNLLALADSGAEK